MNPKDVAKFKFQRSDGKLLTTDMIPPDRILKAAEGKLSDVVLLGWDENNELYFASSDANLEVVTYLLQRALFKVNLMAEKYKP